MYHVPAGSIQQQVLPVPVPEAQDVAHHGPRGGAAAEFQTGLEPRRGLLELLQEPAVQQGRHLLQELQEPLGVLLAVELLVHRIDVPEGGPPLEEPGVLVNSLADPAESEGVRHPFDHAAVLREGHRRERPQPETAAAAVRGLGEQAVRHGGEFHQPSVFPQVVLGLEQEDVRLPIAPQHGDLLRLLKGVEQSHLVPHALDCCRAGGAEGAVVRVAQPVIGE
mmetsp:Transcript_26039/g.72926  ORF Transcript_26039/g.72926 Transcript_26039/m.72926 type:complete len:222 (-) Transcript_26039:631-1296(-)